jgi:hypothetical protein
MQVYLTQAAPLIEELARASDLRTLEAAHDITRRIFAKHIAAAWAREERWVVA